VNVSFAPLRRDAVDYLSRHIGVDFTHCDFNSPNWFCTTARNDDGGIMGVLACELRSPFDFTFNTAITDRYCLTRRLLRTIFKTLFSVAVRITAEIPTHRHDIVRMMERMGFVYEGYCRLGINGVEDALVYGMLREDCKFLPGYAGGTTIVMEKPNGQRAFTA
jgi:hypothetical protein